MNNGAKTTRASFFSFLFIVSLAWLPTSLPSGDSHKEGTPPDQALKILKEGNQRFVGGHATHPDQSVELRAELSKGQKPHSIILSCSDSRVGPELVFDQGLGQVFSVRTAGQILEPGGIASMEYALEHLGSRLLVIMGHESCGAVKAAVSTPAAQDTGSPNLNQLVWTIQLHLREQKCVPSAEDKKLVEPVKANVVALREQLLQESQIVREFYEHKGLKIVLGVYSLETGKVEFWDVAKEVKLAPLPLKPEAKHSPH